MRLLLFFIMLFSACKKSEPHHATGDVKPVSSTETVEEHAKKGREVIRELVHHPESVRFLSDSVVDGDLERCSIQGTMIGLTTERREVTSSYRVEIENGAIVAVILDGEVLYTKEMSERLKKEAEEEERIDREYQERLDSGK